MLPLCYAAPLPLVRNVITLLRTFSINVLIDTFLALSAYNQFWTPDDDFVDVEKSDFHLKNGRNVFLHF